MPVKKKTASVKTVKKESKKPDNRQKLPELAKPFQKQITWINYRIREKREALGFTQTQLGSKLGFGKARMREIEKPGQVMRVDLLFRVLKALGTDCNTFFLGCPRFTKSVSAVEQASLEVIQDSLASSRLSKESYEELAAACSSLAESAPSRTKKKKH